jgi:hypothetical protein
VLSYDLSVPTGSTSHSCSSHIGLHLLQELAIGANTFGKIGAKALKAAIPRLPNVHTLLARENEIPEDVLVDLYHVIAATGRFRQVALPQVLSHIANHSSAFVTPIHFSALVDCARAVSG